MSDSRIGVSDTQRLVEWSAITAGSAYLGYWIGKKFDEADAPGRKLAVARGNTFNTIPAAEIENWKKAAQPVIDDWVKDVTAKGANGKALLESARSLIEKYSK